MKRRIRALHRQSPSRTEPYLKFLKPGTLAQLRDSRISAKSRRLNSLLQISAHRATPPSSPSPTNDAQPQLHAIDAFPCFSTRIFGPRCPQRKKLVAAKTVLFLSSRPASPVPDSPDPIISGVNNDSVVVAH